MRNGSNVSAGYGQSQIKREAKQYAARCLLSILDSPEKPTVRPRIKRKASVTATPARQEWNQDTSNMTKVSTVFLVKTFYQTFYFVKTQTRSK